MCTVLQLLKAGKLFSPLPFCMQAGHMFAVEEASEKNRFIK